MEFFDNLRAALSENNGQLTLQQVTDMLPNSSKHTVMSKLNAARNSGVCRYGVRFVDGQAVVSVTSPQNGGGD